MKVAYQKLWLKDAILFHCRERNMTLNSSVKKFDFGTKIKKIAALYIVNKI
jgi:hypothetical protein